MNLLTIYSKILILLIHVQNIDLNRFARYIENNESIYKESIRIMIRPEVNRYIS